MKKRNTIVLVDDDHNFITKLKTGLEQEGLSNVIPLIDSTRVMKYLSKNKVSILLLDLVMPDLAGEELLQQVKKKYPICRS